jgi:subtilisin
MKSNASCFAGLAIGLFALACRNEPTTSPSPISAPVSTSMSVELARQIADAPDVAELAIELAESRPEVNPDSVLIASVRDAHGIVFIAIKAPESPRVTEAFRTEPSVKRPGTFIRKGVRAAVGATVIRAAVPLIEARGARPTHYYPSLGVLLATIEPDSAPALRSNPFVDYLSPNTIARLVDFNVPVVARPTLMNTSLTQTVPWGIDTVRARLAWPLTRGNGAKLLIIDDGYDRMHEDLPSIPLANCLGLDGCISTRLHGTRVAGVAVALDNTLGVVGVAPGISPSDIYSWGACAVGACPEDRIVEALEWAKTNLVKGVINMSFIKDNTPTLASAVADAYQADIFLVAAMNNGGQRETNYPAAYDGVLGVSGLLQNKQFASVDPCGFTGSSWGPPVDLAAPFQALSTIGGSAYDTECGNSFAAPHMAGIAALVRAYHPTWASTQVMSAMRYLAQDLGVTGFDEYYGAGLARADLAVGLWSPLNLVASVVASKPRITWESIPMAVRYDIYRRVTMTIHPLWAFCTSTTSPTFTDYSTPVSSFAYYNDPPPAYPTTAVGYYVRAVSADGVQTGVGINANFYAVGSPQPVC